MKSRLYLYGLFLATMLLSFEVHAQGPRGKVDEISQLISTDVGAEMGVLVTMGRTEAGKQNWYEAVKWFDLYDKRLKDNGLSMASNKEACRLYITSLRKTGDSFKADRYQSMCFSLQDKKNKERYLEELAFIGQYKFKDIHREEISENGVDEFGLTFISDRLVALTVADEYKDVSNFSRRKKNKKYALPNFVEFSSAKDIHIAEYFEGRIFKTEHIKGDINTDYAETTPSFSKDRKELYFSRTVPILLDRKKGKLSEKYTVVTRIFKAVFDNLAWRVLGECDINVGKYSAMHPVVSPDGKKMYFVSDMPSGYGGFDVYEVDIYEDGSFGEPINLGGSINSPGNEVYLSMNNSGDLFFASDGLYGYGGFDVFVTYLEQSPFIDEERHYHAALNLGHPVNTFYDEFGFVCDSNGRSCFFSSNRPDSKNVDPNRPGAIDLFSVQVVGDLFLQAVPRGSTLDNLRNLSPEERSASEGITNPLTGAPVHRSQNVSVLGQEPKDLHPMVKDMVEQAFQATNQSASSLSTGEQKVPAYKDGKLSDASPLQSSLSNKKILELSIVYFDFEKISLSDNGKMLLGVVADILKEDSNINLQIQGHTDKVGSEQYNQSLSLKRAIVARDYLVSKGIKISRLECKGFGETRLQSLTDDAKNRRVEFEVKN